MPEAAATSQSTTNGNGSSYPNGWSGLMTPATLVNFGAAMLIGYLVLYGHPQQLENFRQDLHDQRKSFIEELGNQRAQIKSIQAEQTVAMKEVTAAVRDLTVEMRHARKNP